MDHDEAMAFVKTHGIVLASAKGPFARLADAIAGEPVRGSWWGHPKGKEIFRILRGVAESDDVLVCRLCGGKVTYVHRRLWPALVRAAAHFKPKQLAKLREEHTVSGKHVTHETAYPGWIPEETRVAASKLTKSEALEQLRRCADA
ncbi:MAG TPA: hypothetical protein VJ823_06850 [Rhodanobacteraceae bacterium]|nr:hypothetical protein [Rhodanobacteraceae bacterium]